jgi:AraC-like DNA-binding protein
MKWVYYFLIATLLLWSIVALGIRVNYYDGNPHSNSFQCIFFVLPVFIYWVSFNALIHPSIFTKIPLNSNDSTDFGSIKKTTDKSKKYLHSGLRIDEAIKIKKQLIQTMENQRPYLDPDLKLKKLASLLGIKTHHLSQVLNGQLNCNFYDFVNGYRIELAKKHLQDISFKHYTIEAIAYDSGFNSKSTFNTLFKKQVGQTPGQWRKKGQPDNLNFG